MEPTITERPAVALLGVQVRINPMQADYTDIWRNQYEPRHGEIASFATDEACLGVYFDCGEAEMSDFVAGRPVAPGTTPPEGLVVREMPGGSEAVFECTMTTIGPTWGRIFGEWLPTSGYAHDEARPCYERFAPGCHEGAVPVTIHVPVRKA